MHIVELLSRIFNNYYVLECCIVKQSVSLQHDLFAAMSVAADYTQQGAFLLFTKHHL